MIALLFLALLNSAFAQVQYSDLPRVGYFRNPYYISEGYRLGFIIDLGLDYKMTSLIPFYSSYEGLMMVGYGTDKEDLIDPYCMKNADSWIGEIRDPAKKEQALERAKNDCYIFTNPWPFSTLSSKFYEQYTQITNAKFTPVLIYYVSPFISVENTLITKTKNFAEGVYPVNGNLDVADSFTLPKSEMPVGETLNVQKGSVDGRIVQASLDHWIRKSFEVTIQEGPYGNNFRQMSVSNQDMFDFIIKAMLTGKIVRVHYLELTGLQNDFVRIGKDYDTPYRVVGVEIRKESSPTGLPSAAPPTR